jgi:hypothetical protein
MKIRINKDTNIDLIVNSLFYKNIDKKEIEIRKIIGDLIIQDKKFLMLNVKKYSLSKHISIYNDELILYIRSDNLLDRIKKKLNKYV